MRPPAVRRGIALAGLLCLAMAGCTDRHDTNAGQAHQSVDENDTYRQPITRAPVGGEVTFVLHGADGTGYEWGSADVEPKGAFVETGREARGQSGFFPKPGGANSTAVTLRAVKVGTAKVVFRYGREGEVPEVAAFDLVVGPAGPAKS